MLLEGLRYSLPWRHLGKNLQKLEAANERTLAQPAAFVMFGRKSFDLSPPLDEPSTELYDPDPMLRKFLLGFLLDDKQH